MTEVDNTFLKNVPDEWEPTDSILQKKICAMVEDVYPILQNFPKTERHDMAAEIKRIMFDMVKLTVDADNHHRKTALEKLDIANKDLKKFVRLSFRLRFMAPRQYKRWSGLLNEIGKIIGGRLAEMPRSR